MLADLRYARRTLPLKPGFGLTAILILALGIGVTTSMFSLADAILWKSIPLPDAGRLVMVLERRIEQQQYRALERRRLVTGFAAGQLRRR